MSEHIAGLGWCYFCCNRSWVAWIRLREKWNKRMQLWEYSEPRLACRECREVRLIGRFRYFYGGETQPPCAECYTCQICNVQQYEVKHNVKFNPASVEEFVKTVEEDAKWWVKQLIRIWHYVTLKWVRVNLVSWKELFKKEKKDEKTKDYPNLSD